MLERNFHERITMAWQTAICLVMALFLNNAKAQDVVPTYECVRMDTFDVHPLHNEEGVKSFAALIDASKQMGVLPQKEALTRAFEAAEAFNLRPERVAIAFQLLRYYSAKNDTREKRLRYANLVKNDLALLANTKHSEAWNLIAYAYSVSGDEISALSYYQKAYEVADSTKPLQKIYPLGNLADTYLANQDTTTALQIIHRLVNLTSSLEKKEEVSYNHVYDYTTLARIHLAQGAVDSSAYYVALAIENSAFFKKGNHRYEELQSLVLPVTIRLRIAEKNREEALQNIALLETIWPSLAMLLKAEYYESVHEIEKALKLTSLKIEKDLKHDRSRIQLRRKLALALGNYKIAEEASSQLWAIARNNLELSKKSLVTLSKAQMDAFESERQANSNMYEQRLEALKNRQRNWLALILTLSSLGISVWFHRQYMKSKKKSVNLSKIVTKHERDIFIANKKLAQKVRSMEQFNHLLSHDLREPLRSISGFSSILRRKATPYKELHYDFNLLSQSIEQLNNLMTGVEQLRKVTERRVKTKRIDVQIVLNEITKDVRSKYNHLTIDIDISGNLGTIQFDDNLLYKSLLELVDNAAKFCQKDHAKISITVQRSKEQISFYVQDKGVGINPMFQQQIFGVFKRLNRREHFAGAGIGLSIVKLVAEKCNGSIALLASDINEGSTFQLTFPLGAKIEQITEDKNVDVLSW